jgi:hypothetical protein
MVSVTHLFNQCLRLLLFPKPRKEAKVITSGKPGKDPKFSISLLPTTEKLYGKVILKTIQNNIEERGLLNASQFGFRVHQSTTLQCMRPTDDVTLKFNNNMSTAVVFLDIE